MAMHVAFVHSVGYTKIPQTGQLLNDGNIFLMGLEVEVRDQGTSMVGEGSLPDHRLFVSSHDRRGDEFL